MAEAGEVDVTDQAFRERRAQPNVAENLRVGDVMQRREQVGTVPHWRGPDQVSRLTCSMLMISWLSYTVTVYQIVTLSAGKCSS